MRPTRSHRGQTAARALQLERPSRLRLSYARPVHYVYVDWMKIPSFTHLSGLFTWRCSINRMRIDRARTSTCPRHPLSALRSFRPTLPTYGHHLRRSLARVSIAILISASPCIVLSNPSPANSPASPHLCVDLNKGPSHSSTHNGMKTGQLLNSLSSLMRLEATYEFPAVRLDQSRALSTSTSTICLRLSLSHLRIVTLQSRWA